MLDEKGQAHKVKPRPRVLCNNVLPLRQFTLAGQGIRCNPRERSPRISPRAACWHCCPAFGRPPWEIHAITPPQREIPEKVRRVISALRSHFAEHGQSCAQ